MAGACASAVLLACFRVALAHRVVRGGAASTGADSAVSDLRAEVDSLRVQLAEKEAALARASAAGGAGVEGGAGEEGGEARFAGLAGSAGLADGEAAPAGQHGFLDMRPQELLRYKRTVCGARWPSQCDDHDSNSTGATDGWLCDPANGRINGMTIYKNEFNGLDAGPGGAKWKFRPRCVQGQCRTLARDFGTVGIKKISEVGAQICEWALAEPTQLTVTVNGVQEKVDVKILDLSGLTAATDLTVPTAEHREDFAVQLSVPVSAVEFLANKADFRDEAAATKAIQGAIAQIGAVETAVASKMCGHGFTNGKPKDIRRSPDYFLELMTKRARRVAEVAKEGAAGTVVEDFEAVAHLLHVDAPCAGLIIRLNGAAAEACAEGDWEGAPLPL